MAVDYTPTLGDYTELKPFRYWCQKVLPLVYDDSLSYYELLCKVVDYLNKTMEDVETLHDDVENLHTAYEQLQTYVNEYFDNLDVQNEINHKLDYMATDGSLTALIAPYIPDLVTGWLNENITPTTPPLDKTLTIEDAAADAKAVGDRLAEISGATRNLWIYGDQVIDDTTHTQVSNINLAPGTYTISALITEDAAVAENARVVFYKTSVSVANRLANPLILKKSRNGATFTLSEKADIVHFQYGASASTPGSCSWTKIQLETGTVQTPYVEPVTANDTITRQSLQVYDSIHALVGTHYEGTIKVNNILPDNLAHPMILVIDAKFTQSNTTEYPYLTTSIMTDRNLERSSMRYKIGGLDKYEIKKIRAIPYIWDKRKVSLTIKIPEDCTLTIRNIYALFDNSRNNTLSGVQFHAHDGACNIAPQETVPAFKMAYESGYNSAIVIPKITSDGVWFAYHDDTFDISTTILKNPDGTTIASSDYDGMYFNQIPWSYLTQFKVGNYGATFDDVGLMKLDEFFEYCAMTGITPVFSMHPRYGIQDSVTLGSLKNLVNKYGLLDKLIIKMPLVTDDAQYTLSNFTAIFGVFGNDIDRYEAGTVSGMANPGSIVSIFDAVSATCTRPKTIEFWAAQILADETLVSSALSHGYAVSCCGGSYTDISGETLSVMTSEIIKYMINLGVTEFTEQYNTSNGLYW